MRIISGKYKGSKLFIPSDKNTRPLKDLARESIFNVLVHSKKIQFELKNAKILDLYSGTGSFGLECLSREANKVFFVENNIEALKILVKNINKLKMKEKTSIIKSSANSFLTHNDFSKKKVDLIFLDPPFKEKNIFELINNIYLKNILGKNGILIMHRNEKTTEIYPENFKILDTKKYGISKIIFGNFLP